MPEPLPNPQPTAPPPEAVPRRSSPRPDRDILRPDNDRLRGRRQPFIGPPITSDHPSLANNPGRYSPKRPSVYVFTHDVDWGAVAPSDLDSLTWRLIAALEPTSNKGCFYFNSLHSVTCPSPTAEFYRQAIRARSSWLRSLRQTTGNFGFRQLSKSLSPTKRQLTLSGVLFVDGVNLSQPTWQAEADHLLNPNSSAISISRRCVDLSALVSTGDASPLIRITREQLQVVLADDPTGSHFVCPALTVSSPSPTEAFYEEARRAANEWDGRLRKKLGTDEKKALFQSVDVPDKMLLSGILVINGDLYVPGCWPNQAVTNRRLKWTPFKSRTVPPDFLGLDIGSSALPRPGPTSKPADAFGPVTPDAEELNEHFKMLFGTSGSPPYSSPT